MVSRVTNDMLETSEDWKYEGCSCNSRPTLTEEGKLECKKCPGKVVTTEPKYDNETIAA